MDPKTKKNLLIAAKVVLFILVVTMVFKTISVRNIEGKYKWIRSVYYQNKPDASVRESLDNAKRNTYMEVSNGILGVEFRTSNSQIGNYNGWQPFHADNSLTKVSSDGKTKYDGRYSYNFKKNGNHIIELNTWGIPSDPNSVVEHIERKDIYARYVPLEERPKVKIDNEGNVVP